MNIWRRLCLVVGMGLLAGWAWLPAARATDASGGTESVSGGYRYHVFTGTGNHTLTVNTAGDVEVLVVAGGGGGGGGQYHSGGGGAGGLIYQAAYAVSVPSVNVTVGGGGTAGVGFNRGGIGVDSVFGSLTAKGGGGGGTYNVGPGRDGGSGGGGAGNNNLTPGSSIASGQGNGGGTGFSGTYSGAGGGGGAGVGAVGLNGAATAGGAGGIGLEFPQFTGFGLGHFGDPDFPGWFAGGGGGSVFSGGTPGGGGKGGGGAGSTGNGENGDPNTGGGGGGAERTGTATYTGGAGGSGIVIVRYPLPVGSITIDVTPDSGSWTLTAYPAEYAGPTSGSGDLGTTTAPEGSYTVQYGVLAGYSAPADQTLSVIAPANTAFSGTYTVAAYGELSIDVTPDAASWTITAHPPEHTTPLSGTGDLTPTTAIVGSYTVHYEPLTGYSAPADQTLSVVESANTAFSGTYASLTTGTLSIDVTPDAASWTITAYPAGYTTPLTGTGDLTPTTAPVGSYTVQYDALMGYDAPADQTLSVAESANTAFSGVYVEQPFSATGGTTVDVGGYRIHTFTSDDTITFNKAGVVDVLVVGGGGGGGGFTGGGGGAGGVIYETDFAVSGGPVSVTVGGGGTAGAAASDVTGKGGAGNPSIFSSLSAGGGGGGGQAYVHNNATVAAGSGGGAGSATTSGTRLGQQGTAGQGNDGGNSDATLNEGAGGGGGAGGDGGTGDASKGGNGGPGFDCSISGVSLTYAAGGGGAGYAATAGNGVAGVSGNAGNPGQAGTDGRGGGGGGGGVAGGLTAGGKGGSGIVIVRYLLNGSLTIDVTPDTASWTLTAYPGGYAGPTSGTGDLGATVAPPGSYTVQYDVLAGWIAPAAQTLSVVSLANTAFSGTYVPAVYGTLSIDVEPGTASWTITSHPPEYTTPLSGTGDLPATPAIVGSYTVDYEPLAGYSAPADQTLSVVASANTAFSGTYALLTYGTLSIDVTPNAGSWTITAHPPEHTTPLSGSGDLAATTVPTGSYTVEYGALAGYAVPADQTLAVIESANTAFSGVYLEQAFSGTGGTVTHIDGYRVHTYTSTGDDTLIFNQAGNVDVLVVGGGGGGGGFVGGGGGGGGVIYQAGFVVSPGPNNVTVGVGGTAGANAEFTGFGGPGGDSVFSTLTAVGGGRGGAARVDNTGTAGSGGGAGSAGISTGVRLGQQGTAGQGHDGGNSHSALNEGAGGGGGADNDGSPGTTVKGGDGGPGVSYSISGASVTYAAGGGGAKYAGSPAVGGSGVPGVSGNAGNPGGAGTDGRGGGGGGGGVGSTQPGGKGGSGIVIVRYAAFGTLSINVTPNSGSWTITVYPASYAGPTSGSGDLALTTAPVGSYTVSYGALAGYGAPAVQTLTVEQDANAAFSGTYSPVIKRVDASATGAGNGVTWADAYPTVQAALAAAVSGDELWVAAGTYKPGTLTTDRFNLKSNVALYGGFAGTESARSERNWANNVSILSGDLNGNDTPNWGNRADNAVNVLYASGLTGVVLDGFTVRGGYSAAGSGGGFYVNASDVAVANCLFTDNRALYGGGLYLWNSPATIESCRFVDNSAYGTSSLGGGLFAQSASAMSGTIQNCVFSGNRCEGGGNNDGGAAWLKDLSYTVVNCTIYGNYAGRRGGGLKLGGQAVTPVTFTLKNSIVLNNTAGSSGANLYIQEDGGTLTVDMTYCNWGGVATSDNYNGTFNTANLQEGDPLFENAGGGDFHLTFGSPCKNAGTSVGAPETDLDGITRDATPDIGAYEYVTPLTVTIDQALGQADPTSGATIHFTVVFSAAVVDFATGDVTLGGTAGATTAIVTGSGTTYNVAVSGMTVGGTVIVSIDAGRAQAAAGNANLASTSTDNTVTYNEPLPNTTVIKFQ